MAYPKSLGLSPPLYDYLLSVSLREPDSLAQLRAETAHHPAARMQIAPEQGQLMALLVRLLGATRTLDIGVFTGYSSLVVALALPPQGRVIACDRDPTITPIAQRHWQAAGVADKIDLRLGDAVEILGQLLDEGQRNTFDFAFIDADKANYGTYYEQCLALVRPGGLIVIDNVLWGGKVIDTADDRPNTQAIRTFNAQLLQDDRVDLSLIPVADGLTLARKR
ncbi:class I SAM-dependent methyltransferase [Prochlorothrix hollandica]|uniref:SAM-dependent methyltransferase n=1 Tax=Prochlorothrix hollandica PCC 9006 = CALU 1027 TaxID=317619 RepID=A0A0M2PXC3_PROHO|nr:class I SAM-dependent methyltransferase [Prochlorothrix hollandica]KKJ01086.1 SAM-dependent methyltransferase [Prochlorothrix hollandica PCC 9006 = CALU 1027]